MNNLMKTAAKIGLTGALAITGLAGASLMDSPANPLSASQAEAASAVYLNVDALNTYDRYLTHSVSLQIQNQTADHKGRAISWRVIEENNQSKVIQSGNTSFQSGSTSGATTIYKTATGTLDTSKLEVGKLYLLQYNYSAGGVNYHDEVRLIKGSGGFTSVVFING